LDQCASLAVAHSLHLLLAPESNPATRVRRWRDLAWMDSRSLNPIYVLGVLWEIYHRGSSRNERMLRHVGGYLNLRVTNDVVIDVVVRDYELLPIFLVVNRVYIECLGITLERHCRMIFLCLCSFFFSLTHLFPLSGLSDDFAGAIEDHLRARLVKILL
jgi:hypothetical protein